MRFLFWWRRRRPRLHAIDEAEAYARSYGERSEEIVAVERVAPPPPPPVAPPPAAASPAPATSAPPAAPEPRRPPAGSRLTDAALRNAFLSRLASRSDRHT